MGKRTGVWAQPGVIDAAEWEFKQDTERCAALPSSQVRASLTLRGRTDKVCAGSMVSTAEDLFGPFVWTRYDMVVLPSSFPFGGMEYPQSVLLTPALVVGDRSQVDVVAHELAHFWHGNLVSCAEWDSFWLNEVRSSLSALQCFFFF